MRAWVDETGDVAHVASFGTEGQEREGRPERRGAGGPAAGSGDRGVKRTVERSGTRGENGERTEPRGNTLGRYEGYGGTRGVGRAWSRRRSLRCFLSYPGYDTP